MTLPPQPFGFVAGRWVLSIGDTPDDPDRAPDYIPVPKGRITFTPALSHRVVPDPTTHPDGWTGIIKRPVVATLGPQGQLIDGEGHDFIALPLGIYSVSYDFEGTPWPSHYLEVTAESTVESPLWLPTESPLPTGPGVVQVVTEETRIAAEAAAARAELAAERAENASLGVIDYDLILGRVEPLVDDAVAVGLSGVDDLVASALVPYATTVALTSGLAGKQDAGDYATTTALSSGLAGKQPVGDYATRAELPDLGAYATTAYVDQTVGDIDTALSGILGGE